jgi:hypothetical protein
MLREAFGEPSWSWTAVLKGIHVSRPVECQLKMTNVQGDQAPAKRQKLLKNFESSSTKTVAEQYMSSQTPFGSLMEFTRRSQQKHAAHCREVCSPTLDKRSKAAVRKHVLSYERRLKRIQLLWVSLGS